MSDVEVYQGELSEIGMWARDANEIAKMAGNLVQTSFVPQSFNGKPAEATAAILTGMEVGLKPMAALRSIIVINGTPALTAQALRGLAQAAGHRIWVEESTSQRAVVKGIRRGDDQVQTSVWDVQRATAAGLMTKAMYKTQAQSMFVARASSELVRLIASDVVMGLAYSIEELQDDAPPVEEAAVKRPSTRAVRKPLPEKLPAEEPKLPAEELQAIEAARLNAVDDPDQDQLTEDARVREAEIEERRQVERELADEARERAAAAFSDGPAVLEEPDVEWDLPAGES